MKKFIVLVICALIGMLSIPHVTLWNFSLGSETAEAATIREGELCDPSLAPAFEPGALWCGYGSASNNFKDKIFLLQCRHPYAWWGDTRWEIFEYTSKSSMETCLTECRTRDFCKEPPEPAPLPLVVSSLPSPLSIGGTGSVSITGGTPPYSISTEDTTIVTASVYGSTVLIAGKSSGSTTINVFDSLTQKKTISVTVTGSGGTPPPGTPPTTPLGTLGITVNPSSLTAGSAVQLIATTTSVKTTDVQSHVINWEVYQGTTYKGGQRNIQCNINYQQQTYPGCSIPVQLQAGWNGYELRFSSQLTFKSGTGLSSLDSSTQRVTIGSTIPPPGSGTGVTVSENPITMSIGQIKTVSISGGTPPYTFAPFVSTYMTPAISGNNLVITGVAGGTSILTIGDSTRSNSVDVSVTVGTGTPPGGGTTSGGMTYTVTPSSPTTNNLVTIQFSSVPSTVTSLDFQMIDPQSGTPGFTPPRVFQGMCPPNCQVTFTPSKVGTYHFNIKAKAGNSEVASIIGGSVDVATSGTPGTGTGRCCLTKPTTSLYSYDSSKTSEECQQAGGLPYTTTCVNARNTECDKFCRDKNYNGGSCNLASNDPNVQQKEFPNSADSAAPCETLKCRCSGTPILNPANVPCAQACNTNSQVTGVINAYYTQTSSYLPIGQCTSNPSLLSLGVTVGTAVSTSGGSTSQRPPIPIGNYGEHGCGLTEMCYCTLLNTNTFTASTSNTAATLPGTQTAGNWRHPNDITDSAPKATPNEHDCTLAGNATITASLGIAGTTQTSGTASTSVSRLIQAGETVTITGKVTKMSDACKGYKYTCTTMQQLGCESHNRVLWTSLDYKDCPSGTTQIHAEGDGDTPNWRLIAAAVVIAVTWGAAAAAAGPLTSAFYTGQSVQGAMFTSSVISGVGAAINGANCGGSSSGTGTAVAGMVYQQWQATTSQVAQRAAAQAAADAAVDAATQAAFTEAAKAGATQATVAAAATSAARQAAQQAAQTASQLGTAAASTFQKVGEEAAKAALTNGATQETVKTATQAAAKGSSMVNSLYAGFAGIGTSLALNALPTCPTPDEIIGCFSVCGKSYETQIAASPLCNQGGPVIGFTAANYPCVQGSCGAYDNKRVKIDIRGPDGLTAIEDYVTTDSLGDFSYTFQAPAADGEFTAIVSVPRD